MEKNRRPRTLEQIIRNFADHLFSVERSGYDEGLDDMVAFRDGVVAGNFIWTVLYNPANGHFICSRTGTEIRKEWITEESERMQGTPWYDELLGMIYCPEEKGEDKE